MCLTVNSVLNHLFNMTNSDQPATVQDNGIDEKDFADYIRQHPDFFERHPSLLAQLVIPHPHSGQAVSLLERKVLVMREQQDDANRKLRELVANARKNEKLHQGLEETAILLISLNSLEAFVEAVPAGLKKVFELEHVALSLEPDPELLTLARKGNEAYCTSSPDADLLGKLFKHETDAIASAAILPLDTAGTGLMVFASSDGKRYPTDSGTRYICQLQRLLNASLARLTPAVAD